MVLSIYDKIYPSRDFYLYSNFVAVPPQLSWIDFLGIDIYAYMYILEYKYIYINNIVYKHINM